MGGHAHVVGKLRHLGMAAAQLVPVLKRVIPSAGFGRVARLAPQRRVRRLGRAGARRRRGQRRRNPSRALARSSPPPPSRAAPRRFRRSPIHDSASSSAGPARRTTGTPWCRSVVVPVRARHRADGSSQTATFDRPRAHRHERAAPASATCRRSAGSIFDHTSSPSWVTHPRCGGGIRALLVVRSTVYGIDCSGGRALPRQRSPVVRRQRTRR
jgi:hypothetical protein